MLSCNRHQYCRDTRLPPCLLICSISPAIMTCLAEEMGVSSLSATPVGERPGETVVASLSERLA